MPRRRLQVTLSPEDDRALFELRRATTVSQRTKDRATALRLNHRGWNTEQIAEYLHCQVATVRQSIHRWESQGLPGLWDGPRSGRPRTWAEADIAYVEDAIQASEQTVNSRELAEQLEQDRQVKMSSRHLRRVLKARAGDDSEA